MFTKSIGFQRVFSSIHESALKQALLEVIPERQTRLKELKKKYGNEVIGQYTLDQVIGGMRNIFGLFWDLSLLNSHTGIIFQGKTIPELQEYCNKAPGGDEPLPEDVLFLLMTGKFPSASQSQNTVEELRKRSALTTEQEAMVLSLPKTMHPMSQFSASLLFLQQGSKFAQAYKDGTHKSKLWEFALEDSLDLLAKLPRVAALIYRNTYKDGDIIAPEPSLDWAGNYSHMMGYESHQMKECIRGYLSIHSDHEGGNVSAHTSHLVGSALADPYLSYSAALNGLAGPLHGLANQEVLRFLLDVQNQIGINPSNEELTQFVVDTINSGKVIPGYGHAVLRHTDPRYVHQREFAQKYIHDDPLVELTRKLYHVVPPILKGLGKVANPWPNVDAHSGVLLYHYGMREYEYYTVVFGVSRAIGCMSNLVWSRIFGLPIERPGSINMDWITHKFERKPEEK